MDNSRVIVAVKTRDIKESFKKEDEPESKKGGIRFYTGVRTSYRGQCVKGPRHSAEGPGDHRHDPCYTGNYPYHIKDLGKGF